MKTVLVAGGAGFIGSHLIDALLNGGYSVICVDNLITGSAVNLITAANNKNYTFLQHDITETLPEFRQIDYIFHLASPASVIDYQKFPLETAKANSLGTLALLELAKKHNAHFLFASTSEVYGDPKEHPQKESYWGNVNPNGPRSCYDESKRFGEAVTKIFSAQQVDTRIVRIFNTYGPRMRKTDGRVISNFINQAIEGKPLTVYGDGSQTRSFCYVSDLIDGLMGAMFTPSAANEVINLGNPQECTMLSLAKKVLEVTGSVSKIEFSSLPVDDPLQRKPDITKAKTLLGWEPRIHIEEGLNSTVQFYKNS